MAVEVIWRTETIFGEILELIKEGTVVKLRASVDSEYFYNKGMFEVTLKQDSPQEDYYDGSIARLAELLSQLKTFPQHVNGRQLRFREFYPGALAPKCMVMDILLVSPDGSEISVTVKDPEFAVSPVTFELDGDALDRFGGVLATLVA